jgi:hypothetical protein
LNCLMCGAGPLDDEAAAGHASGTGHMDFAPADEDTSAELAAAAPVAKPVAPLAPKPIRPPPKTSDATVAVRAPTADGSAEAPAVRPPPRPTALNAKLAAAGGLAAVVALGTAAAAPLAVAEATASPVRPPPRPSALNANLAAAGGLAAVVAAASPPPPRPLAPKPPA